VKVRIVRRGYDAAAAHLQPGLYLARTAGALAARGHEADVAAHPGPEAPAAAPDAVVWCLGPTSFLRDPARVVRASAKAVVAFVPGPLYSPADLRRNLGRLRWTHLRDHAVHLAMAHLGLRRFVRQLRASCDHVVVPTRRLRVQLLDAGLPAEMVTIAPCGLDRLDGRAAPAAAQAGARKPEGEPAQAWLAERGIDGPYVVNFGPIRPVRGVDTLVEAAPRLGSLHVLVLARAGDGDPARDRAWLEGRIRRLPREAAARVHLHQESLARPLLHGLVRQARVAAFPLRLVQSVQPAAVHEAFQLGVPAALSDVAPLDELADGPHAGTFPVGDAAGLAQAVAALDAGHREARMACEAWVRRQPSWDDVARRFEEALQ
jgi:glycosyltransferase involved in cell wall biosynthesis